MVVMFISVFLLWQDAHELFSVLTSTLDEESLKFPCTLSLFDLKTLQVS